MKLTASIFLIALSTGTTGAFVATIFSPRSTSCSSSSSAIGMGGFLEGRGKKITIREDEDSAMWFDDGSGGRVYEPKKPDPKKPVKKEDKKGAFKFPWEK